MKRILVTGASGFLGWNLIKVVSAEWDVYGTYFHHNLPNGLVQPLKCDLTDFDSLVNVFQEVKPHAVVHLAAISDPNYCQANSSSSQLINQDVPVSIAGLCADYAIPMVFTSTDLVFDGVDAPYSEDHDSAPINTYGKQKANAEKFVHRIYSDATICRMPLMFGYPGPSGTNSTYTMILNLLDGKPLRLFTDEYRTPVSGYLAAQGLKMAFEYPGKIIHLGGAERMSRFELGIKVTEVWDIPSELIEPVLQDDVPMLAPRASDLSLDSSLAHSLGYPQVPVVDQLSRLKDTMKIST